MALFGKKSKGDEEPEGEGAGNGQAPEPKAKGRGKASKPVFEAEPGKAQRFFEHARAMHESANYEYAMTLWLQGIRKDPTSMTSLERFFDSAANFRAKNPKGPTKEQTKQFGGRDAMEKFLANLLQWGAKPQDWSAGFKAMQNAAELELDEQAYWIGEKVMAIARGDKKAKKDTFVSLMDVFEQIGGFDKAVQAGEVAMGLDPRDAKLEQRVRNMSATATMSRGGYEKSGAAGGFRANIRDLDAQRARVNEEAVVKTEATLNEIIERAALDFKARPTDEAAARKLGKLLLERGTPDDEKTAMKLYLKMYKDTQAYSFKVAASDIRIRMAKRDLRALKQRVEKDPSNAEVLEQFSEGQRKLLEFERKEYEERVANYPTDQKLKFDLGVRCFRMGDYEAAITALQGAIGAPALTSQVQNYLGQAFSKMDWLDEAESSFRAAIEAHPSENDDFAMDLRYGLMVTLERKAEASHDPEAADEAFKLASAIAVKQIGYRDIRERRARLQNLAKEIKAAG